MKNISRRVFIKGMAVAAAATAASTVLAGCNFVPGTEETVVTGFTPETKTLTVEKQTFTVSTTSFTTTADGYLKVGMKVVNDTDDEVTISGVLPSAVADKNLGLSYCVNGEYNALTAVSASGDASLLTVKIDNNDSSATSTESYTKAGYVYVLEPKEWNTITLVCVLNLGGTKKEVTFVLNK